MPVRKVGNCRIVRELGRGGMGVVYEALQEDLDRSVAVKELSGKYTKEMAERFRREGRAYAQLRHQAIVAVHDLVEKEQGLYLITEFVDGADLSKLVQKGGPLPPACVALVGARVAEALDYVHFSKLLHRDVKPGNIMVTRDGDVKLMDFGIAKDFTAKDLTRDGMLVGSPSYMAPEVLAGERGDARADIWALGITLYELATGRKPFLGANAEDLFAQIRKGRYPPVRELAAKTPRRIAAAIERCLEPRPRHRWKSAGALARELDRAAQALLKGMHPRARLVALMANRGFEEEKQALTHLDAASLLSTRAVDAGEQAVILARPGRSRWRWAALVAVALAAGAVAWLVHAPNLLP